MTRSKLSDADKQNITQLFRESEETIVQLADRFEVSASTIRRILKNQLPGQEYEALIATKQEKRIPKSARKVKLVRAQETPVVADENTAKPTKVIADISRPAPIKKRMQSNVASEAVTAQPDVAMPTETKNEELAGLIAEIEHDLHDQQIESVDEDADLDEFSSGDSDDFESDDIGEDVESSDIKKIGMNLESAALIQVLPLSEAKFPKTCYLVIDRSAELITCPLQAFGELGMIPEDEVDAKTLPIFDNHRIARRFSHRTQRIVKVPNSSVLQKTCSQLVAKGITRLLMNGHVYSL